MKTLTLRQKLGCLALIMIAVCMAGCQSTTATYTATSGTNSIAMSIRNTRAIWTTESYAYSFNTNGTWSASANKSGSDAAQTISAATALVQTVLGAVAKP